MSFAKMTIRELAAFLACKKELCPEEVVLLEADQRRGAADLLKTYYRRRAAQFKEEARLQKMLAEEKKLWE
ncbi:MAG: ribonuclease HII, partial [Clostridia bacterium]|nr:ribonuclease HII [Clostridia bacterium]